MKSCSTSNVNEFCYSRIYWLAIIQWQAFACAHNITSDLISENVLGVLFGKNPLLKGAPREEGMVGFLPESVALIGLSDLFICRPIGCSRLMGGLAREFSGFSFTHLIRDMF